MTRGKSTRSSRKKTTSTQYMPTSMALRTSTTVRQQVYEKCMLQSWEGIDVKLQCENRGRGVVATQMFAKGAIIADYHAVVRITIYS
jgi:hypothetical protein